MRVRQDRRAPARYLAVPAWLAASLLSRVRAPSSAPFGGTGSRFARGRRGTTGATWTCRRCGAVAQDLGTAQRHVASVHRGESLHVSCAAAHAVSARFP
jgi:hypothetical protein